MSRWLLALGLGLQAVVSMADAQTLNGFDVAGALVPAEAIVRGGPPKDGIPAIDNPKFVAADAAGLAPGARVLGVARQGINRAYPVRLLNWHEVVNDRFGDEAVTVTYCPLCGTGIAFESRPGGFGVSGLLYNSDVLLYDRATQSLWSQIMQQAVSGPLKGARLRAIPLSHTSWADWHRRHPDTRVLSTDTGFVRDYDHDPYAGYDKVPNLMFEVQRRDDRLPPKEWVLGLQAGGQAKAYPFSLLARRADAEGRLQDRLGGQAVEIRFDREHLSAEAFDADGKVLTGVTAYWFAWFAFHPQTEVLAAP